ncbi:hypothetical protein M407DRAFT_244312 [Tulasnella calospora MUT 4182]|uniref:Uncharacterized protein n=1 Tax=Tulasnella calospora MUT 4182 TaxID=1051891 RepID=A0A0C3LTU9_9AGAM|nr:hypothetical protein M407DRAFT_244312 [Tulasnella calospora MUT 4182]
MQQASPLDGQPKAGEPNSVWYIREADWRLTLLTPDCHTAASRSDGLLLVVV